jgi:hypothetical protein
VTHLGHLAARFVRSLGARRPSPVDQEFVRDHLAPEFAAIYWQQPVPDLDHTLRGARWIVSTAPGRPDLVRAFLLHDVGKRRARLGTFGRSVATALDMVRLPVGERGRAYLDHARIGADELESSGADPLVVAFARHHHHPAPAGVDLEDWALLATADRR